MSIGFLIEIKEKEKKINNDLVVWPSHDKIDDFYFASCPPELHFCKTKKLLRIKEYKELLEPTLDHILPFFTKISENKTWAEDLQYDSL